MRASLRRVSRLVFTPQRPMRRLISGLIIGAIGGGFMTLALYGNLLSDVRTQFTDGLTRPHPTRGIISIVAIDDASLGAYGRSTVDWDRAVHADLIRILDEAGARVIVFDVLFADPSASDAELAQAMDESCKVVQPVAASAGEMGLTRAGELIRYSRFDHPLPLFEHTCMERPHRLRVGHVNVVPDADGAVRRMPLFVKEGDTILPSLAMAAYMNYSGVPMDFVQIERNRVHFNNANLPVLPTDDYGRMLIRYFGPPSHIGQANNTFPVYSLVDVVEGQVDPAVFQDQIVLVGALDATALPDSYATPSTRSGDKMFGVEIHANAIETLYQSLPQFQETRTLHLGPLAFSFKERPVPLREQPLGQQLLITFLLGLGAGAVLPFLRWYIGLPLVVLVYGIYFTWATNIAFPYFGMVAELVFPALSLGLTYIGMLIVVYIFEERRRSQIHDLFSRYVSPEIAHKIVDAFDHGKLELGGEEREITVLFADVRGFTTLSEGLPPTEVVRVLNIFLEEMNIIVMRHGGAINKYIGDNLMAFWNAPYPQKDHALLATQAALEMLRAIVRLNETKRFSTAVQFGIGINTGPAVVGNIGSSRRLEYTPIGDTVNVASRLSGAAPGGACYIGARTYELLRDQVTPAAVHHLMLKGKQDAVTVYELHAGAVTTAPEPV